MRPKCPTRAGPQVERRLPRTCLSIGRSTFSSDPARCIAPGTAIEEPSRPRRVIGRVYFGEATMTLLLIILLLVILLGGGGYYGYRGGYYGGGGLGIVGVILLIIVVFALFGPISTYH